MKSVIVYVEGVSDQSAMTALFAGLIEQKLTQGIAIQFTEAPPGDKKASVIRKVPKLAVSILQNKPDSIVVAMPDLYPLNKEVPHATPEELFTAIRQEFDLALKAKGLADDSRYQQRFKVFCFKYELEALMLAAEKAIALHLGIESIKTTWKKPVEDQNNDYPPKKIISELFNQHSSHYVENRDGRAILELADYHQIAEACPQQFRPFVEFLEALTPDSL